MFHLLQVAGFSFSHLLPETVSDGETCDDRARGTLPRPAELDSDPSCYIELAGKNEEEAAEEVAVRLDCSRCLRYCAPELYRALSESFPHSSAACDVESDSAAHAGLDERGDVFSFAFVVWELCAGEPPLAQHSDPSAAASAAAGGARPPLAAVRWATGLAGLLERAWASEPAERCSADDAVAASHGLSSAVERDSSGCVGSCALA